MPGVHAGVGDGVGDGVGIGEHSVSAVPPAVHCPTGHVTQKPALYVLLYLPDGQSLQGGGAASSGSRGSSRHKLYSPLPLSYAVTNAVLALAQQQAQETQFVEHTPLPLSMPLR